MLLTELKGVKSLQKYNAEQLLRDLMSKGVFKKPLGKGSYAIAIELSGGDVLKVWQKDEAYEKYIEYCMNHKSDPYLVKTFGKIQKFGMKNSHDDSNEAMKFLRIEKLEIPLSLRHFGYKEFDKTRSEKILTGLEIMSKHPCPNTAEEIYKFLNLDEKRGSDKFIEFVRKAFQIGKDIRAMGLNGDFALSNFGFRGEQIVFMDPAYAMNSKAIRKIIKV
jgi:hypothetical protein